MTDLQTLKQIERQLNIEFKKVSFDLIEYQGVIYDNKIAEYAVDADDNITGLIIVDIEYKDISYQIHKEKVTESYFHCIFHTILAENGLNPISEESTNSGRIDVHLTIGQIKYLFELKSEIL